VNEKNEMLRESIKELYELIGQYKEIQVKRLKFNFKFEQNNIFFLIEFSLEIISRS